MGVIVECEKRCYNIEPDLSTPMQKQQRSPNEHIAS